MLTHHMISLALPLMAAAGPLRTRQTTCAPVHIIVARASGEEPGEGIIGKVSSKVQTIIPGADSEAVDYPAISDTTPEYKSSVATGTAEMTRLVTEYAAACPGSQIVMMGYSQGGQVALDALCGTSSLGFGTTEALPSEVADKGESCCLQGIGDADFVLNSGSSCHHGRSYLRCWRAVQCGKCNQLFGKCNDLFCTCLWTGRIS
jgi:hypothetical protein